MKLLKITRICHTSLCVLLYCWLLIASAIETGCENCGCCVDKVCSRTYVQGAWKDDFCTHGCIDGIGGNKCYIKCPDDCVTCEQVKPKNCATCETGKYLTTVTRSTNSVTKTFKGCVDCPNNCKTCDSETNCQECENRYYNTGQYGNCSEECPNNCKTCTSSTNCQECYTPYYNQGTTTDCSLSCPGNCVCSSPGICSSCKDGFFNVNQQCVSSCSYSCQSCLDQNTCQSCKDGYFNRIEMSTNNEFADQKYAGSTCEDCVVGFYGETCDVPCLSTKCANNICNRKTGACTSCQNGFYGQECEFNCSQGCKSNVCDFGSGTCVCRELYSGNKCCVDDGHCRDCASSTACETCEHGYLGTNCEKPCPCTCAADGQNSQCEKTEGKCLKCWVGFYGDHCNNTCNDRCANNLCDQDNGHCIDGYVGDIEGPTGAQVDDTARIVGIASGVSAATIVVVIVIVISAVYFILRRWKRRNEQVKVIEASYVNTEFQSEISDQQENVQTPYEYEALDETEYDEIK